MASSEIHVLKGRVQTQFSLLVGRTSKSVQLKEGEATATSRAHLAK